MVVVTVSPARWLCDAAAVRIADQPLSTAFHAEPANCLWLIRQDAVHEPGSTGSKQEQVQVVAGYRAGIAGPTPGIGREIRVEAACHLDACPPEAEQEQHGSREREQRSARPRGFATETECTRDSACSMLSERREQPEST